MNFFSKMNYHSELSFGVFSKMIVHYDSSFQDELSLSPSSLNFFSDNDLNGPLKITPYLKKKS